MWNHGDFGWLGFAPHGLGMLVFWGFVIFISVLLFRTLKAPAQPVSARREDDALEILRERFARGELSEDAYRAMREKLADD